MPHCIIEHSSNLNGHDLLARVFQGAFDSKLFDPQGHDIKVRAISYDNYQTGQGQSDFIHVVVKLLSGRSLADKQRLSSLVLAELSSLAQSPCIITVEVVDIERESYAKLVV